jgi:hypothetical protein
VRCDQPRGWCLMPPWQSTSLAPPLAGRCLHWLHHWRAGVIIGSTIGGQVSSEVATRSPTVAEPSSIGGAASSVTATTALAESGGTVLHRHQTHTPTRSASTPAPLAASAQVGCTAGEMHFISYLSGMCGAGAGCLAINYQSLSCLSMARLE